MLGGSCSSSFATRFWYEKLEKLFHEEVRQSLIVDAVKRPWGNGAASRSAPWPRSQVRIPHVNQPLACLQALNPENPSLTMKAYRSSKAAFAEYGAAGFRTSIRMCPISLGRSKDSGSSMAAARFANYSDSTPWFMPFTHRATGVKERLQKVVVTPEDQYPKLGQPNDKNRTQSGAPQSGNYRR